MGKLEEIHGICPGFLIIFTHQLVVYPVYLCRNLPICPNYTPLARIIDKMATVALYNVASIEAGVARLKKQTSLGQLLRRWAIWVNRIIHRM